MFDATKGLQAVIDEVETRSNEFAARFDELTMRQQLTLLQQFNQLLDAPDQVSAFQAGTYAQNSAGQPAAQLQLGAGGNPSNPREMLAATLRALRASKGQAQGVLRILNGPGDPGHMEVDDRGTWTALVDTEVERDAARAELTRERDESHNGSLAKQLADVTAQRDAARAELTNERDVNRNGSLAKQLAEVTAQRDAALNSAGGYDQANARTKARAVLAAVDAQHSRRMSGEVEGKDAVRTAFTNFAQAVGLQRQS